MNVEGLGGLAAEPDPPPRNSGGMKPSTVAGSGPNTRNPAGGADGVWVGSVGGSLPKLAIGQRRSGGVLAQLAINHLVARRSGEVQAVFPFSERSEHAPPVRGTGTPEGDLFGCVRPKEEVDPPVAPTRTTGGPGVLADPGPFPWVLFGASSARAHQHDDEAGGDNCGLQIQRRREVGGGLEKFEEGGHAAIRQEGVRRPITLNGTMSADAKPAGDVSAPPRRWPTGDSFAPAPSQHSGLPPRSQAAASASRCCGPPRGRGFSLSFGWEAMQRLRPIFVIGSPYCPLPEVLCDHRPSA